MYVCLKNGEQSTAGGDRQDGTASDPAQVSCRSSLRSFPRPRQRAWRRMGLCNHAADRTTAPPRPRRQRHRRRNNGSSRFVQLRPQCDETPTCSAVSADCGAVAPRSGHSSDRLGLAGEVGKPTVAMATGWGLRRAASLRSPSDRALRGRRLDLLSPSRGHRPQGLHFPLVSRGLWAGRRPARKGRVLAMLAVLGRCACLPRGCAWLRSRGAWSVLPARLHQCRVRSAPRLSRRPPDARPQ